MNQNREVPIEVTSRHDSVSERMRSYVTEKVAKLIRFHPRISRIQVVVDEAHASPEVESTFVGKERNEHFRGAVDLLVDKMERQLKKDKERLVNHKGEAPLKEAFTPPPAPPAAPAETYDDVVRRDLGRPS
jgi:putative sigma-54 modulation protein